MKRAAKTPYGLSHSNLIGSAERQQVRACCGRCGRRAVRLRVCWEQVLELQDPYLLMMSPAARGVGQLAGRSTSVTPPPLTGAFFMHTKGL